MIFFTLSRLIVQKLLKEENNEENLDLNLIPKNDDDLDFDLTPEEYKFLKEQKENEGISFRGTIRKALREYMKKHEE